MLEMMEDATAVDELPALPLPEVVDTAAVVLAGLLSGGYRPLVLDASRTRKVQPAAAPLLETLLLAKRQAGAPAHIVGASPELARRLAGTPPLAEFLAAPRREDEVIFTCLDREAAGFLPSER